MNKYGNLMRIATLAIAAALPVSAHALRMTKPPMDMQQLTRAADDVVVGTVVEENTVLVGKRFETNYTVQVQDSLKTRSGVLAPGGQFTLTLPGGALTTPPLTQYVSGVPYLSKGEDVVLFLRQPTGATAPTRAIDPALQGNLQFSRSIVGWNQGRFSVLKDPATGERLVTRVNLEDYGLMNTSKDMRRVLDALAENKIPTVRRAVLNNSPGTASDVRGKDPLEVTGIDEKKLTVEERQTQAQQFRQARQRQGIAVEPLDSFAEQVRQFSNQ